MMQNNRSRKPGIALVRGVFRFLLALSTIFGLFYLGLLGVGALIRLKTVNDWVRRSIAFLNKSNKRGETLASRLAGTRVGSMYFSIGTIQHVGRKSGREYKTTLSAYPLGDGFVLALAYPETDWCRNILASGKCTLTWRKHVYELERPEFIPRSQALAAYPLSTRLFIWVDGTSQFLWLHKQSAVPEQERALVGEQDLMPDATSV